MSQDPQTRININPDSNLGDINSGSNTGGDILGDVIPEDGYLTPEEEFKYVKSISLKTNKGPIDIPTLKHMEESISGGYIDLKDYVKQEDLNQYANLNNENVFNKTQKIQGNDDTSLILQSNDDIRSNIELKNNNGFRIGNIGAIIENGIGLPYWWGNSENGTTTIQQIALVSQIPEPSEKPDLTNYLTKEDGNNLYVSKEYATSNLALKTDLSNYVNLNENQEISGQKTFTQVVDFGMRGSHDAWVFHWNDQANGIKLSSNTTSGTGGFVFQQFGFSAYMRFQGATNYAFDNNIVPLNNGTQNLGSSTAQWKNLYISNYLTDGTNGVKIQDIATVAQIQSLKEEMEGSVKSYVASASSFPFLITDDLEVVVPKTLVATCQDINGNFINPDALKLGDVFYFIESDTPDRWIGGISETQIAFYLLETAKVDLTSYYTKTEADKQFLSINGIAVNSTQLNGQDSSYYLDYNNFTNTPTIPTKTSELTNDSGFLTSIADDLAKYVSLNGIETISGTKTFNTLKVKHPDKDSFFQIVPDSNGYNVKFNFANNTLMMLHNGGITNYRDILPDANGTRNLGSDTAQWKNTFINGAISIGGLKIEKDSSDRLAFYFSNTPKVKIGQLDTLFANRVTPDASNTYDLGRASVYWRDLYLSGNLSDGTNTISIANIAHKDSLTKDSLINTIGAATQSLSGLMSAEDKIKLDTLVALLSTEEDENVVVDRINEILLIFNQYPEGVNLIDALNLKADKTNVVDLNSNQEINGVKSFTSKPIVTFKNTRIPSDYQEVEYIEATGTQYLDTLFKPNEKTTIRMDFQLTSTASTQGIFGVSEQSAGKTYRLGVSAAGYFYFAQKSNQYNGSAGSSNTSRNVFEVKDGKMFCNDLEYTTITDSTSFQCDYNAYIFYFSGNTSIQKASGKLYSLTIYDNETLVRDLVPCYRKSDGVIGMYDTVSGNFLVNQGTDEFIKGSDTTYIYTVNQELATLEEIAEAYVSLDTNQTITGSKTFDNTIHVGRYQQTYPTVYFDGANIGRSIAFQAENYRFKILASNTVIGEINTGTSGVQSYTYRFQNTTPTITETFSLGNSQLKWKDLYLSGNLTDGTNTISIADIASKSGLPTTTSQLTNDSGFITNTVDDLSNYYKTSDTYSKEEVDSLINAINGLNFSIVEILPTENISTNTIYLVPLTSSTINNIYEEFIYLNNQWESIGTTQIDLSNYITKDTAEEITSTKTWLNNQEIRFKNPSNLNYRFHTLADGRLRLGDNSDRTLMAFDQNGNVDLGTIRPKASTGVNIGGSGNARWQDIYFQGCLKDDTYSIKLSDIITNETLEDKLIEKGISDNVAVIIDLTEAIITEAFVQVEEGEEE